jgi:hypothetical protein
MSRSFARRYWRKLLAADQAPVEMSARDARAYFVATVLNYVAAAVLLYAVVLVLNANHLPPYAPVERFEAPVPAPTIPVPTPEAPPWTSPKPS